MHGADRETTRWERLKMRTEIQSKMRDAAMRLFPKSDNPYAHHASELLRLAKACGRFDLLGEDAAPEALLHKSCEGFIL